MKRLKIYTFVILFSLISAKPSISGENLFRFSEEPVDIKGDIITYDKEKNQYTLEGEVEITQGDVILDADKVVVDLNTKEAEASGNVILTDGDNILESDSLRFNLDSRKGVILNGSLFFKEEKYHIFGKEINKLGEENYRIYDGSFTTCECERGAPPWKIGGQKIDVKYGRYATIKDGVFYVKDIPVLYIPYGIYPAKKKRHTGFLMPSFGKSKLEGTVVRLPFYLVINNSMDATFILDNRSNRGTGGDFEYRYILSKNSEGNVKFSIFDQNKLEPKTQRWLLKAYHKERFSDKSYGRIDINLVGDKEYFRDFTSDVDTRTSRYLNSSIYYSKNWDKYSLTSEFKFHKNLIVGDKTTLQILPTINFTGLRQNLFDTPLFYSLDSSFTNFWRDEGVRGQRIDIYPRFSLPLSPGGYFQFTPEVGIRETIYKSSNEVSRINSREIVDLNTTIDTSFERVFFIEKFGIKKLLHSIEPELSYTFIPKVNQKDFPFFDGIDRISNNNLLTYSLTNRILGKFTDEEGMDYTLELLKFRLSQSFDINEERRERISPEDKKRPLSNLRAELSIKPSKYVNIGMNTNYDVYEKETRSLNSLLKIRDKRDDLFQFGYRYNKGAIEEYNTTLDLKVTDYIRAYYESRYSNRDSLWLESKYGVEYKSLCDCWSLRFSFGERVRPSEREFSFLLNLTGLGYIGRRSTFGYK